MEVRDFIASEMNSWAASECINLGHPFLTTISERIVWAVAAAVLCFNAMSVRALVAKSMIPSSYLGIPFVYSCTHSNSPWRAYAIF